MAVAAATGKPLAELVGRTEEAASAWMRGDLNRYLALTHHGRGFTLMDGLARGDNLRVQAAATEA
jgi:hypothetical protein